MIVNLRARKLLFANAVLVFQNALAVGERITISGDAVMPEGRIKTLTNDGFGFIAGGNGDLVFHNQHLDGVNYDDLREGQRVSYSEGYGPKGKRAEHVRPVAMTASRH